MNWRRESALGGRSLSRAPVFQVMLVQRSALASDRDIELLVPEHQVAKFDLTLYVEPVASEYCLTWEYNSELFGRETVIGFDEEFRQLLALAIEEPEIRTGDWVPLAPSALRRLEAFNATAAPQDQGPFLHELFAERARACPDAVAAMTLLPL